MDIRKVSEEEKMEFMEKAKGFFEQIRNVLNTLEKDIKSNELDVQAASVWITGNLANWFNDFMEQVRAIHKQKEEIQKQMVDSAKSM